MGSDQINELVAKLGVDPARASQIVAEHLPTVVDKLTPGGKIDPSANVQQELSSLLPSLLQKFMSPLAARRRRRKARLPQRSLTA